jgi:serine/threonine protein kinase
MGEVWLAEDTRLDRKVALKLLPSAFTQDAERVRSCRLNAPENASLKQKYGASKASCC